MTAAACEPLVAPRLRELAALKAQKELDRDQLKAKLAAKPIKLSELIVREWIEFYEALFADEAVWARKHLIQRLVTSVKIEQEVARLTYNPSLTQEQDQIDLSPPSGGSCTNRRKLPEPDADQNGFTLCDEFAFREIRLTKWRRCLVLLN